MNDYKTELEQYKYQSEHDELTKLFNKRKFYEEASKIIQREQAQTYALVRFDIDRFKMVNTYFGVEQGDRLLEKIGEVLKNLVFHYGIEKSAAGRITGDIFVLCIPYEKEKTEELLDNLREKIEKFDEKYDIVPSIGIYLISDRKEDLESMYAKASMAANRCKGSYVKLYAYYDDEMRDNLIREQEMTNCMNAALEEGQFQVYLQPQFNLQNQALSGCEALVRWVHPEHGVIPPADFIPLFEKNGFITKLDYFVWEEACKILRRWLDEGICTQYISVNVSRVDVFAPQFCNRVMFLTKKYQIPPELLHLELTESAYIDNAFIMKQIIERLRSHGFWIMMDDFGSGYSSLNMLKDIDIDVLKVDMKFLEKSDNAGRGENILMSVIRMAKWLNLPTVAEGIETKEQADFLRSIGCDYGQGYLFARPMKVSDYEEYAKEYYQSTHTMQQKGIQSETIESFWSASAQVSLLFNSLVHAAGIYELHGDNLEMVRINDGFFRETGENRENFEQFAKNMLDVVYEEDRQKVLKTFQAAIGSDEINTCEYRRIGNEEEDTWIHLNIRYILSSDDRHLFYGAFVNISNERRKDELIVREGQKIEILLENSDCQVWDYDIRHNRCIQQKKAIQDYEVSEVIENAPEAVIESGVIAQESVEEYRKLHEKIRSGVKKASAQICYVDAKGKKQWNEVTYKVSFDVDGKPMWAVGCQRVIEKD